MATDSAFDLLHPGVQEAIWEMGWKQFHPIQSQAIKALLGGTGHLLISAPTAGGKTEAAFLPIISRLAERPVNSVQAMYVGPLKALINDQFRRLAQLCETVKIPVHSWHGDIPASQKKAFRERPGGILLITPESLESNFINYGLMVPRIYRDLDFVVIDELHSLIDNVRGVHLRSLLCRLQAATGRKPRLVGLSATLANPHDARMFLDPDEPGSVGVIEDRGSGREIKWGIRVYLRATDTDEPGAGRRQTPEQAAGELERLARQMKSPDGAGASDTLLAPSTAAGDLATDELDEIAGDISQTCAQSTNLVFVNSRALGEVLVDRLHQRASRLRWTHDPFHIHHGSIARELRAATEDALRSGQPATVVCSSTLELGIDIGYVRAVAQVDPPWTVASMLQRLGRSGRRDNDSSIMRMYVREDSPSAESKLEDLIFPDLLRAIAMTRLMLARWLEPINLGRWNLSTLIHQIMSCLKQTGGITAAQLHRVLVAEGAFRNVNRDTFMAVLRGLGEAEVIEQMPDGPLILAPKGEGTTSHYSFYASFMSSEEYAIRCGAETIGMLQADLIPPLNEHFILAGRRWRVEEIDAEMRQVRVAPARGHKAPLFRGTAGDIDSRIIREMRQVLTGDDQPAYLDIAGRKLLKAARRFAASAGIADPGLIQQERKVIWFPWVGTRALRTLHLLARAVKIDCQLGSLSLRYGDLTRDAWRDHMRYIVENSIEPDELASLAQVRALEKYDELLPEDLQCMAFASNNLDVLEARQTAELALQAGAYE